MKNKNIDECVIEAYNEYMKKDSIFKLNLEDYLFKTKKKENRLINSENLKFKIQKRNHLRHSNFINEDKK